jgi:hypothetical protein
MPIDTVNVNVTKTGGVLTSSVTFNTRVPTTFMQILGSDEHADFAGTATARYETPSYMDFYMLLDNTPFDGRRCNDRPISTKMKSATAAGHDGGQDKNCAFACHIVSTAGVEDKNSYYNVARNNGVTIRIDVVAAAVKALMQKAHRHADGRQPVPRRRLHLRQDRAGCQALQGRRSQRQSQRRRFGHDRHRTDEHSVPELQ